MIKLYKMFFKEHVNTCCFRVKEFDQRLIVSTSEQRYDYITKQKEPCKHISFLSWSDA